MSNLTIRVCGVLALGALVACGRSDSAKPAGESAVADSMGVAPTAVQEIPVHGRPDMVESSVAVMSPSQPDIVFTVNDSGNAPLLFALDTTGAARGAWTITEATNTDWEAAALGPCARTATTTVMPPASSCIYIGDVGDNSARRSTVTLYQVEEPTVAGKNTEGNLPAEKLVFRYPDGAHDVEAMYVARDGSAYFLTKRPLKDSAGHARRALIFTVPAASWERHDTVTATLADSLPIVPGSADSREITDASLSTDSRYLAVRTYGQVFVFATDSTTGRVMNATPPAVCNIEKVEQKHGEGIAWFGPTRQLLLNSEGRDAPMHRVTCPLPQR